MVAMSGYAGNPDYRGDIQIIQTPCNRGNIRIMREIRIIRAPNYRGDTRIIRVISGSSGYIRIIQAIDCGGNIRIMRGIRIIGVISELSGQYTYCVGNPDYRAYPE